MSKIAAMLPAVAGAGGGLPLALASTALQGVGGYLQARERNRALERRNEATEAIDAQARQVEAERAAQAQAALDQLVQQHTAQSQQQSIDQATAAREEALLQPSASPPVLAQLPGADRAGRIVQEDAAQQMSEAAAETRKRLAALARLSGFGAAAGDTGTARALNAGTLSATNDIRRGNLAAARDASRYHDLELQNFRPSPLGGLLAGAGQLGSYAGGYYGGLGGRGPAPGTPSYYGMDPNPSMAGGI